MGGRRKMPLLRSWEKSITTGCYKDVAPSGATGGRLFGQSRRIQSLEHWDRGGKPARVQGCLISAFSFASVAAISSKEGACHSDMYGSRVRKEPAARVWPSGENLSETQLPGRSSSVVSSCSVAMFHSFTLRS